MYLKNSAFTRFCCSCERQIDLVRQNTRSRSLIYLNFSLCKCTRGIVDPGLAVVVFVCGSFWNAKCRERMQIPGIRSANANVCFAFDRFRCFVYVKYLAIFMQQISDRIKRLIKHWTNGWMSGFQPFRFVDIFQAFTYSTNEYPCQKCNYHILRSFQLLFHRFFRLLGDAHITNYIA